MQPVSPVIPGQELKELIVAEHQKQYGNLPSLLLDGQVLLTRWELTEEDKAFVAEKGYFYLRIWTYGTHINPMRIDAAEPHPDELPKGK